MENIITREFRFDGTGEGIVFPSMKKTFLSAMAALVFVGTSQAGFDSYNLEYAGTLTVAAGKKSGNLSGDAFVAPSVSGDAATFEFSALGAKGISAEVQVKLNADGSASLDVDCKVLADPRFLSKREENARGNRGARGKKVRVKYTATGTYVLAPDGFTTSLNVSNNRGKNGTNVTGLISKDAESNLTVTLNSGFKQKLDGLGRRLVITYLGAPVLPE